MSKVDSFVHVSTGGTPRNLDEVILLYCPHGTNDKVRETIYWGIRDFLAQRFGVAYMELSHDPAAFAIVERLFELLTKRPAENSQLKQD